jgi:quercetin dioxygenase-like cupin family protein
MRRKDFITGLLLPLMAVTFTLGVGNSFSQYIDSEITMEQFTGEVLVTSPDGTQFILKPGLPVPEIPPGSTIEVLTGTAVVEIMGVKISLAAGDAVRIYDVDEIRGRFKMETIKGKSEVFVGLTKATMDKGDIMEVRINQETSEVSLIVLAGSVEVEQNGVKTTLSKNKSFVTPRPFAPSIPTPEPPEPEPIEASPFL